MHGLQNAVGKFPMKERDEKPWKGGYALQLWPASFGVGGKLFVEMVFANVLAGDGSCS